MLGETAHTRPIERIDPSEGPRTMFKRARVLLGRLPVSVWLAGLVLSSVAYRLLTAMPIAGPWIVPDELVYADLARSFGTTGHFAIRGEPFSAWSFGPLYPILIAPIFRFADPTTAYVLVKTANSLLFSLAAVPAYLLARRVLTRERALILAGLAVVVPSAVYTSKVMTESLAYPLFLVAVLAIARAIEAPTWRRELAVVAAIAAATLARGQLVVLFPAFLLTLVVVVIFDQLDDGRLRDLRHFVQRLRRYRTTWLTAILGAVSIGIASSTGLSGSIAGGHGEAFASVSIPKLAASFAYHVAELDLYVGMLPFAALVIVSPLAFRRRSQDRSLRIICALTISLTALLAAAAARYLVAVYATAPDPYVRVYDRYEFYVAPLFLISFLVWLQRGLPRPSSRRVGLCVAAAAALLPAILPLSDLLNKAEWGTSSSSVALVPWGILRITSGTLVAVYAALVVGGTYLAYLFLRSNSRRLLLLAVAANLAVLNVFAQAGDSAVARNALGLGIGPQTERSWVDAAAGRHANVAALWSGVSKRSWKGWYAIWENEFFNVSIGKVYDLREPMRYKLPADRLRVRGGHLYLPDGRPFVAEYVLTDTATPVIGRRVATDSSVGMALYRVDGPVRLRKALNARGVAR
jgi:hypothetical protein